jgi:hypothetical protein
MIISIGASDHLGSSPGTITLKAYAASQKLSAVWTVPNDKKIIKRQENLYNTTLLLRESCMVTGILIHLKLPW